MLSYDVLVLIYAYIIFQQICPINKTVDILQIIYMKAQTNYIIPYHIGRTRYMYSFK